MITAYDIGYQAFCNDADADENPHYTSFGDLSQDYYDWNKGWNDAEDAWYRKIDDDETEAWYASIAEDE